MAAFNLGENIIKVSFDLSVWLIRLFSSKQQLESQTDVLRKMPNGTLGKEIAKCLEENEVKLVSGFESHDLKHVVLGYKMTPRDEIRMQAYMLGNGNYSFPCFAILIFGIILLPTLWARLYNDFKKGRKSIPISKWTISEYAHKDLLALQEIIKTGNRIVMMSTYTYAVSKVTFIAGIGGMLFCFPFLFSSSIADLVGAGLPFIGGAILVAGGLIAMSNVSKTQFQNIK